MSLRDSNKRRREEVNLELTPLIDIVFLLLIFFLITATFSNAREADIPIDLPAAETGTTSSDTPSATFFITKEGRVELKGEKSFEGKNFSDKLQKLQAQSPDARIVLKGDKRASHGRVVEVLDQIKSAGFSKVNLIISKEVSKKSEPSQ